MLITKVLSLSTEEVDKLVAAGQVLGSMAKEQYDEISPETVELLTALKDALNRVAK